MDPGIYQTLSYTFCIIFASILWGCHACLFLWFLHLMLRKPSITMYMRLVCFAGFVLSTVTIAVNYWDLWNTIRYGYETYRNESPYIFLEFDVVAIIGWTYLASMLLSDSVQIWRCFVLWGRSRVLFVVFLALLGVSLISGLIAFSYESWFRTHVNTNVSHTSFKALSAMRDLNLLSSICLNILATALTAWKIRSHTQEIRNDFGALASGHRSLKHFELLTALVVESGIVYTVSQLYYTVSAVLFEYVSNYTEVMAAMAHARVIVQMISCMYPTSVILFAEVARHIAATYTIPGPALPGWSSPNQLEAGGAGDRSPNSDYVGPIYGERGLGRTRLGSPSSIVEIGGRDSELLSVSMPSRRSRELSDFGKKAEQVAEESNEVIEFKPHAL